MFGLGSGVSHGSDVASKPARFMAVVESVRFGYDALHGEAGVFVSAKTLTDCFVVTWAFDACDSYCRRFKICDVVESLVGNPCVFADGVDGIEFVCAYGDWDEFQKNING